MQVMFRMQRAAAANAPTSAFLHQQQRERSGLSSIFDVIADDTLTPAVRETVEAVGPDEVILQSALVERLRRSKSTVSERVTKAVSEGWLNRTGGKG